MANCPICKDYMLFPDSHKCNPEWDVWTDYGNGGNEDDARKTFAVDARQAAEKYSEWHDMHQVDYPDYREVLVRPHGTDAAPVRFEVYMEATPTYTAHEMKAAARTTP